MSRAIETIRKLIAVAAQVLYRNLVVRSIHSALEQAESVLNRIGVVLADCVGAYMVNLAMAARKAARPDYAVNHAHIGLQCRVGVNVLCDDRLNAGHLGVFRRNQTQAATALNHSNNHVTVRILDLRKAFAGFARIHVGFVRLNDSVEQSGFFRRLADAMAEMPHGTIVRFADSKIAANLQRAHTLLCLPESARLP